MTTATEIAGLTKLDIQALRQADRISFHTYDGKAYIRGTKELVQRGPFDDKERSHEVACDVSIRDYNQQRWGESGEIERYKCFAMLHCPQLAETQWPTVAKLLRPGDELTLVWVADGTNYTKECGLHFDALRLEVRRNGHRHFYVFEIETSICPDNSARMIQRR